MVNRCMIPVVSSHTLRPARHGRRFLCHQIQADHGIPCSTFFRATPVAREPCGALLPLSRGTGPKAMEKQL